MDIALADYTAAAELANDLVRTSPTVHGTEDLPDRDALGAFLDEYGYDLRTPADDDVREVHFLRREVRGIIETETAEQAVAGAAVLLGRAGRAPVLRPVDGGGRWRWHVPTAPDAPLAAELAAVAAVGIAGTVRALGHDRFRACAAPACRGVFADVSRAGRRRYCTPALCGNRLNVANHRARTRTATP
ncbi:CGNR zinc finger domain-containing protein [Actinomadura syzygii]|uniref:CGNR zinc finger domain-containing protein n=1 Tax=Actinomadura syzygii TaxID=1427538 RepID=A0A5D0UNB4_9ACTN|nr:CGNR zinc finger domain-containing protein [Actinomadura syzygii]TYC18629.1 CGNR zinc finger domain-containing protein [Actinomadura syzygii]